MGNDVRPCEIARITHLNHHTINCALRLSRLTGSVVQKPLQAGCPRQHIKTVTCTRIAAFKQLALIMIK
jgi:hypothetical protein